MRFPKVPLGRHLRRVKAIQENLRLRQKAQPVRKPRFVLARHSLPAKKILAKKKG